MASDVPDRSVRVLSTKYDGSPHYDYEARFVDHDRSLLRLYVPVGTTMTSYRGVFPTRVAFTALFFTDGDRWYNCYHNHWTGPRASIESYANVSLPAAFDGETVRWVDLDLDVLVRRTGGASIVDHDEFLEHRERFAYPDALARRAADTAAELLALARERRAPFDRESHLAPGAPGEHAMEIVPLDDRWRALARESWVERWGSARVASRGQLHELGALPGFAAIEDGTLAGVATYRVADHECEVVTIESMREGISGGTQLLEAVVDAARAAGCRRAWLVTTNDNAAAIRFYQRRGWRLVALHRGAVDAARATLKPEIPLLGDDDIPIRDELEFELTLDPRP
ncbi:MAG: GNAT family N-acetyltransferase [Chloroflexi bacterium]|nr:GNAT family N-acetyltransferase [Chloroflexota bacterium]